MSNTNSRTLAEIQLALEALLGELRVAAMGEADAKALAPLAQSLKTCADFNAAVEYEIIRRHTNGEAVPGAVVKDAVTQRKWHDDNTAAELAYASFGLKAFKLCGPAAIEKLGDEGKALAAVASYKPAAEKKQVVY